MHPFSFMPSPDEQRLGALAGEFRSTRDEAERQALARDYAETVDRLIRSGRWHEMPGPEDQLPDDWMPQAFFDYLFGEQDAPETGGKQEQETRDGAREAMTAAARQLLHAFDALPEPDKRQVAVEIQHRMTAGTEEDLPEETRAEAADELFRTLDEAVEIFIPLLNEGVDVLRPTRGLVLGPDEVQVLATPNYDSSGEEWEFPPGSRVRCVREIREGRELLVARHRIA